MRVVEKFSKIKQPFVVGVLTGNTPQECISCIKKAEFEGADAFSLRLSDLETKYHNREALRDIFLVTNRPIITVYYRWNLKGELLNVSDEERLHVHLEALEAGSAGFDLEADFFAPTQTPKPFSKESYVYSTNRKSKPLEITRDENAINRQKDLIKMVQNKGGEVMLSAHTRIPLTAEQIVEVGKELASRGPDLIKIVGICLNYDDLIEGLRGIIAMKKELSIPFQFQCHGEHGKSLRVIGPLLGSMLVFSTIDFKAGGLHDQPPVGIMKNIFNSIDCSITRSLETEKFL